MNSVKRLENKVAIVTGSSRGIGKAIALEFAEQGAKLVITYNQNESLARDLVTQIQSEGGEAFAECIDIRNRLGVKLLFEHANDRFKHIDVLVNNAGYLEQKPFRKITDNDWDDTLDVNLKGAFICTQEIIPYLEQVTGGSIINISSVGGQMGGSKAPHYAAAKAGVISLTKSTARLLAPLGIRVNAIAPGYIRTDMYYNIVNRSSEDQINTEILLGKAGEPEDVAYAALFLASNESRYITGHVLNVNGGSYIGGGC